MSEHPTVPDRVDRRKAAVGIVALLVGLALPLVVTEFTAFLLTKWLILALFGLAFNFAFGFAEIPSFGHAAFFGIGGYAMAMTLEHTPESLLVPLVVMLVATVVYAGLVGFVSTRGRGIYFALLTFAFAQGLYEFTIRTPDITGASRGLFVSVPSLPLGIDLGSTLDLYYITILTLAATVVFGYRLLQSPFGKVMAAIRHNQDRAAAIGYPVRLVQIVVFALSGVFSALAGALFAFHNTLVTPDILFFEMSIEVVIIVIIGGIHSLWGPIAGAAVLVGSEQLFGGLENVGTLLTGVLFVLVVLFLPDGISGIAERLYGWATDRFR